MVGMPPTPVVFFPPAVLAALILLVAAGAASACHTAMTKAGAAIGCICATARFRRKVVQQTSLQFTSNLSAREAISGEPVGMGWVLELYNV